MIIIGGDMTVANLMNWSPELDVKIDHMNDQHKELLDLMNIVYQLHNQEANFDPIFNAIEDLKNATIKHFQDEEVYMASIHFPGLATHKIIHDQLLKQFQTHIDRYQKERSLGEHFFGFLKLWLSAHIQGIDAKYGDHAMTVKKAG